MTCIYCSGQLVPDMLNPHWAHCPKCSPAMADAATELGNLLTLAHMARSFASDDRGRPTVGGKRWSAAS